MTEKMSLFKMRGQPWLGCEYEPTIETVRIANAIAGWYVSGEGCQGSLGTLSVLATATPEPRRVA